MKKLILSTVLALAGVASASAQTITPGADDLILSFSQPGNTNNFEVDLGAASNFDQGNPLSSSSTYFFTTATGALNADLSTIYGSNWATTNVSWNVAGIADGNSDLFSTAQSSTNLKVSGSISTGSTNVRGIAQLLNNSENGQAAFGTDDVGVEVSTSLTGSFTKQVGTGSPFGVLKNNTNAAKVSLTASGTSTSMDLFYFDANQAGFESDLGTFKLASNGTLSFGTQAVPEPSTYALGICGMILLAVLLRRKSMRA
jgi:hypothetical protein